MRCCGLLGIKAGGLGWYQTWGREEPEEQGASVACATSAAAAARPSLKAAFRGSSGLTVRIAASAAVCGRGEVVAGLD